ncbi:MAG TPA: MaoC family dehydratase N-terminal domain-containing protein [Dehalococcoidia bacterium]|nr:MaoC family dehydratase N-terminal domain-containing protein [Dehalococcoidia bacterium]
MTTEQQSHITDEMRASIGREGPPTIREVSRTGIRMFARAVGHTDPIFYDVEEAQKRGYRDLVAPPGYLGTPVFNPRVAGEQAAPRRRPGGMTRGLNAGNEYEYFDVICAGDVLESRSRTVDIQERTGSIGPMIITTTETVFTRLSDGKVVAKGRGTGISY